MSDDKNGKKEDQLLASNYDGIQEYDNDLPRWWVQLFYLTVVFGIIYTGYILNAPTDNQTLALELKILKEAETKRLAAQSLQTANTLMAKLDDPQVVAHGKEIFNGKCAACHGQMGEGLVGPNLTDEFWIHGGSPDAIHKTITEGVAAKGMLAWEGLLSHDDINAVTSYVYSLKNKNVPGKAPEGIKG